MTKTIKTLIYCICTAQIIRAETLFAMEENRTMGEITGSKDSNAILGTEFEKPQTNMIDGTSGLNLGILKSDTDDKTKDIKSGLDNCICNSSKFSINTSENLLFKNSKLKNDEIGYKDIENSNEGDLFNKKLREYELQHIKDAKKCTNSELRDDNSFHDLSFNKKVYPQDKTIFTKEEIDYRSKPINFSNINIPMEMLIFDKEFQRYTSSIRSSNSFHNKEFIRLPRYFTKKTEDNNLIVNDESPKECKGKLRKEYVKKNKDKKINQSELKTETEITELTPAQVEQIKKYMEEAKLSEVDDDGNVYSNAFKIGVKNWKLMKISPLFGLSDIGTIIEVLKRDTDFIIFTRVYKDFDWYTQKETKETKYYFSLLKYKEPKAPIPYPTRTWNSNNKRYKKIK